VVATDPEGSSTGTTPRSTATAPPCWSCCCTPASACPSTATRTGTSPAGTSTARGGKTEAWVVAGTEGPDPVVHLGFREAMDPRRLTELVAAQQVEPLLASLNTVPVAAGDTVLVPAGLPHAIGQGVLLVELQEPTDLSVLLEWEGFAIDGRAQGHLGLGFELALGRHGYRDSLSRCGRERPGGLFLRNQRVGRAQFGHLVAAGIGRGDRDAVLAAIGLHGFMAGWP
jgi:hypothetical protein